MIYIYFVIFVIFVLFVFFMVKERYTNQDDFLVVVYENEDHENLKKLINSLEKRGYKYKRLGESEKWEYFGTKINACHEFYKTLNENMIILQIDARDVIVNEDAHELISKYKKYYNNKLVYSAEADCCVHTLKYYSPGFFIKKDGTRNNYTDPNYEITIPYITEEEWKKQMTQVKFKKVKDTNKHVNYLNAGMVMGPVKLFKSLYSDIKIKPHEDDQAVITDYFLANPDKLEIDYNEYLFMNVSHGGNENNAYFDYGKYKLGDHSPSIIQTPGKNFDAYDEMYYKLYT